MEQAVSKIDRRTKAYRDLKVTNIDAGGRETHAMGAKVIPKVRKRRKPRDYSNLKCGSIVDGKWVNDFSLCMHCGEPKLEANDNRRFPEACPDCIWRNDV